MRRRQRLPFAFPGSLAAIPLLLIGVTVASGALAAPAAAARAAAPCDAPYAATINPADFKDRDGDPIEIDNPYFPLEPGTTFVYRGESDGEAERVVTQVSRRTKTILGVRTVVIRDRAFVNGELVELALDWYAQDKRGNVWYFGEDVSNYEDGKLKDKAGSWEAGKNNARAGIIMPARPKVGNSYRQEYAPKVAEDAATVLSLNKRISVPFGTFDSVLQTRDFSCFEPVDEHKYYARGVGLIRAVGLRNGVERPDLDRLELVSVKGGDDRDEDDEDSDDN